VQSDLPGQARFFRGENHARPGPARGPPGPCRLQTSIIHRLPYHGFAMHACDMLNLIARLEILVNLRHADKLSGALSAAQNDFAILLFLNVLINYQ
jgi:hypothetical protein